MRNFNTAGREVQWLSNMHAWLPLLLLFVADCCNLTSLFLVRFALLSRGADLLSVCMVDTLRNRLKRQSICSVVARTVRDQVCRVKIHIWSWSWEIAFLGCLSSWFCEVVTISREVEESRQGLFEKIGLPIAARADFSSICGNCARIWSKLGKERISVRFSTSLDSFISLWFCPSISCIVSRVLSLLLGCCHFPRWLRLYSFLRSKLKPLHHVLILKNQAELTTAYTQLM